MTIAYLAFGANLGDRVGSISAAIGRLGSFGVALYARSRLYETDPVTPDPQPLFVNAAARFETELAPHALLGACLEVERALGRVRPQGRTQAPREIDIDLLLYGSEVIDDPPRLIVPHPHLIDRPFVRIPLADVAARGLIHPLTGQPLDRAAADPAVRFLGGA